MNAHESSETILYLRGMPRPLVREAKAAAARRGITLAALVSEALQLTLAADPPPDAALPDSLRKDADWYETHRDDLLKRYRGEFLCVMEGRVVDHDKDFASLAGRVFKQWGGRPIFLPRCIPDERVVHQRSPRAIRS